MNLLKHLPTRPVTVQTVVVAVTLFMTSCMNLSFFRHLLQTYGTSPSSLAKIATVALVLATLTYTAFSLVSFERTTKPLLILLLLLSSQAAYFMDTYDVVIDANMLQNVVETNLSEVQDLLSPKQFTYLALLGIAPSLLVYHVPIQPQTTRKLWLDKGMTIGIAVGLSILLMLGLSKFYTSALREHKALRFYSNPTYYLYAVGDYLASHTFKPGTTLQAIGTDVRQARQSSGRRLVIVVVGEAARWDHLSLNGYARETTPLLKQEQIINLPNMSSCGTETAVSVPCMFSMFGRTDYTKDKARHTENVLDVLQRAGVSVLWRDNNSGSKGVADRVPYQDFRSSTVNPVCQDGECRDVGMLAGLEDYIARHPSGDILIVLHQMGNHGPAYYKRYPQEFEAFTPVCRSNQLDQCSQASIINGYDNALLYTDYFLAQVIGFLKQRDDTFQTALLYLSDHGESLGELGLYLHGFPYRIAPEAQTHVAALAWFGKQFPVDRAGLQQRAADSYSHDYLFHTLLGMFDAQTDIYQAELDLLRNLMQNS
jgi:lipid A ethanolaminephosphotransferase